LDFIARLQWCVRFQHRAGMTPTKRGNGKRASMNDRFGALA
jgi:hypothetical protein